MSSPLAKNNSLRDLLDTALLIPPSRLTRGAYRDRHGRGARDAMDAVGARDECTASGRRSRVVLMPRRWYQLAAMLTHCAGDGDKKPITRESTKQAVKTIRAGKAGLFRCTCGD